MSRSRTKKRKSYSSNRYNQTSIKDNPSPPAVKAATNVVRLSVILPISAVVIFEPRQRYKITKDQGKKKASNTVIKNIFDEICIYKSNPRWS